MCKGEQKRRKPQEHGKGSPHIKEGHHEGVHRALWWMRGQGEAQVTRLGPRPTRRSGRCQNLNLPDISMKSNLLKTDLEI